MSRYKILKMQKPNLIYIYLYIYIYNSLEKKTKNIWRPTFSSPNSLEKKKTKRIIGDEMFCRLKFNRRGYKFPRVKNIWRQK
jgi:hypothetical protein